MTSDERAYFSIMLEKIGADVRMIAEAHGVHAEKLDALSAGYAVLTQKVQWLSDKVGVGFSSLRADVGVLKTDVSVLKTQMIRVNHHLGLNGTQPARKRAAAKKKPARSKKH